MPMAAVQNALEMGYSPVIVDNTNTTVKEMKPYFKLVCESLFPEILTHHSLEDTDVIDVYV